MCLVYTFVPGGVISMNPSSSMNEQGSTVAASAADDERTNASEASLSNSTTLSQRTSLSSATSLSRSTTLSAPLRFAGFWAAIALPFLHIPLLITGLDSSAKLAAYVALLGLNVLALVVGHSYSPE